MKRMVELMQANTLTGDVTSDEEHLFKDEAKNATKRLAESITLRPDVQKFTLKRGERKTCPEY